MGDLSQTYQGLREMWYRTHKVFQETIPCLLHDYTNLLCVTYVSVQDGQIEFASERAVSGIISPDCKQKLQFACGSCIDTLPSVLYF